MTGQGRYMKTVIRRLKFSSASYGSLPWLEKAQIRGS